MYLVNRCRYFSCIDAGKTKIPSYFLPLVINCFISSKLKGSDLFVIVPQLFSGSNADTATNVTELLKHISFRKQWFTHRPDIDLGMVVASCFGYTYIWIYSGGAGSVRIGDYPYPSTWRDRRRLSIPRRGSMIWFGTVDQLGVPRLPPPTGKDRSFCGRGRWRAARPLAARCRRLRRHRWTGGSGCRCATGFYHRSHEPAHPSLSPRARGGSEFAGGAPACRPCRSHLSVSEQCGTGRGLCDSQRPRVLQLTIGRCCWLRSGWHPCSAHARAGSGGPSALMWRLYDDLMSVSRRALSNPRPVFSRCSMSTWGAQGRSAVISNQRSQSIAELIATDDDSPPPWLCLVAKYFSPNFNIHLSHQIFCLIHGVLNIGK